MHFNGNDRMHFDTNKNTMQTTNEIKISKYDSITHNT